MKKRINKELILKILILIVLIIITGISSFKSGSKFYLLKNMYFNDKTDAEVKSSVSRWYFKAKIIKNEEINVIKKESNF